jgi:hypothetical protein
VVLSVRWVWVWPWLRAYLQAPLGAALGTLLWVAVLTPFSPRGSWSWVVPIEFLAITVPFAYIVGVCLLPVFLVYEQLHWRGARFYVPTAVLAGLVIMGAWQPMASRAGELALGALCGLGSGIVFSVRLRLPD